MKKVLRGYFTMSFRGSILRPVGILIQYRLPRLRLRRILRVTRPGLVVFLCLNLLLPSFYPLLQISGTVYAQEEWSDDSGSQEEAQPAWEPEPVWEPEPQPVWEPVWDDAPAAETTPAGVPQEQVDSCLMYGEGCQYTVPGYEEPIAEPTPEPVYWSTPEPTPVYFEPTPAPTPEPSWPVETPEPVEPTPLPTPEAIPQQQIDACLQYGEGCGVVAQPITDSSSQDQAVSNYWQDYDQTYAATTNNEYVYSETREEDSPGGITQEIVAVPDAAAETSGNWWDGAASFIGTQAENFGQMVTSPFAARTGYAENLYKEAEKTEQAVDTQDQQQAEDLNEAINTPVPEKLAALKEQFGLQNTPNEEAIQIIKDAYSLRGLDFNPEDGSVQKNPDDSYTPSNYSIDFTRTRNPAVSDKQIESCLQFGEGCANPNWTPEELAQRRQQGQDAIKDFTLNLSQIYTTGGKFLENVNTVNEMQPLYDEIGMRVRTQSRLSTYTGSEKVPDYFTNGAFAGGTITPQEIEDDMKANPYLGSPELNAAREQLLELAKEKEERGKEITLEVSAAMLMGSVGGSTALSMIEKAGEKIAARIAERAAGKGIAEDLGNLAVKKAAGDMEPVYVGAAPEARLADIADTNIDNFRRELFTNQPIDNALSPESIQEAQNFLEQNIQAGTQLQSDVNLVARWIEDGISPQVLSTKLRQVEEYFKYIDSGKLIRDAPADIRWVHDAARYDGQYNLSSFPQVTVMDALLKQEQNVKRHWLDVQGSEKILQALEDFIVEHGANPNILPDPKEVVDPKKIHFVSTGTLSRGNFGEYNYLDDVVLVNNDLRRPLATCSHEELHRCFFTNLDTPQGAPAALNNLAKEISGESAKVDIYSNYRKFTEGLTEYANRVGFDLQGYPAPARKYKEQIDAFYSIQADLAAKLGSPEKGSAVLIEAALTGKPEKIFQALGNGDRQKGAKMVTDILDKVPDTKTNVILADRVTTSADIDRAVAEVTADLRGELGAAGEGTSVKPLNLLPWKMVSSVHAAENDTPKVPVVDTETFEFLVKQQLIKNALSEEGKVSSDYVKEVLALDILQPDVKKGVGGYTLTTGKAGTVEGQVEKTIYKVSVNPLPGVDIEIPAVVDLTKDPSAIVAVKIKKGSGQVEKVAFRPGKIATSLADSLLAMTVHAEEKQAATALVKVVLTGEQGQVLPWAGVDVTLDKVGQEKAIHLSAGWNLVTLTALPGKPFSASVLLDQISAQGGNATAVSTLEDGAWKTFVSRGSKDYSTEDFLIEPGKAYFVKALKPAKFSFTGQNFVEPIKLKLSSGWNAVGLPVLSKKTKAQYKVSELLDDLNTQQAGVDIAARWESGLWDTFVKKNQEQFGNNFGITNSGGYILKAGKEMEFSP